MKKPEKSFEKRKAAWKRAAKRNERLRKTKAEKGAKKTKLQLEKKDKAKKYQEMINKALQARASK